MIFSIMQDLYGSDEETMELDQLTPFSIFNKIVEPLPKAIGTISDLGKELLEQARLGETDKVRELMAKGAPFTTDWLGVSPLHYAAEYNHVDTVEVLLRAGISRDSRNKVDRTPLHVAVQAGHLEVVRLLVDFGADVDCRDMLRMTPLHWAAESGHADIVKLLLKNGANPQSINKFDSTPDQIASKKHRPDIVNLIQEIVAMDPSDRPKKIKKSQDKVKVEATLNICNPEQPESSKELHLLTTSVFNKPKINKSDPTPIENKHEVTEIRVMKLTSGKRKNANNEIIEESRVGNEMGTIPNPTQKTLQILQEHGITMLPVDDSDLVTSAMASGQTVVLTEAGKLALNQTEKSPQVKNTVPTINLLPGKRLIKIGADQLINMTKEKKVVIHRDKKYSLNQKQEEEIKKTPTFKDLEAMRKELEEARKQVEMYKTKFLVKQREAEAYKLQLQDFLSEVEH
uniref:Uncharacterized protein n=1 Tax=Clastoptera arizonana TaxID=38151 RepID=A0A1B6CQW1_9HEMI